MNKFVSIDDGTLDTVLACDTCGQEERYTWDGDHGQYGCKEDAYPGHCDCYECFVASAIEDRNDLHECPGPQQTWECCTSSIGPKCNHRTD